MIAFDWMGITIIEDNKIRVMASVSGENLPEQYLTLKGSATEMAANNGKTIIEPDLLENSLFSNGAYYSKLGIRSIVYIPLKVNEQVIGSYIIGNSQPDIYTEKDVSLLEGFAAQLAIPMANSLLYSKAEQLARIDELTGLSNRRALDEILKSEVSRHSRYGGVFSLILLDLDSLKVYNDTMGHLAGDQLLRYTSNTIKNTIRNSDYAFRYGGDEFAVLLPQTTIDEAYIVAHRMQTRITRTGKAGDLPITASLGIASWPAHGVRIHEVISSADKALYQAKRGGKNRIFCTPGTVAGSEYIMGTMKTPKDSRGLSAIHALVTAVDVRDHYTRKHSERVNTYAIAIAEALNLSPPEISKISTCALLHDVGKIGIRDDILNKPGKLTPEEREAIEVHPQLGAIITGRSRELAKCIPGILYHHEKYDGTGYPKGLKGEEIPLEARILAIADAFSAMISNRCYSPALPAEDALEEIRRGSGTQFDPELVNTFLSIVDTVIVPHQEEAVALNIPDSDQANIRE